MDSYFELAQGSSVRLCLALEKKFPDLRGWQLELILHLCLVAYNSEIYDAVCEDAWLRTTITLKDSKSPMFFEKSDECKVVARIAEHAGGPACPTHWSCLPELHDNLTRRVRIHSNVVPRQAYREKLFQELQRRQSFWTWLLPLLRGLDLNSCLMTCRREFLPGRVFTEAVEEMMSVKEKKKEWRGEGGTCGLAMHLESNIVPHALQRTSLRDVKREDVKGTVNGTMKKLGEGGAGSVYEVSWRNGIYARKVFNLGGFEKERDVALRVSHPHIVHPFGHTCDPDGKPCLLMEVLNGDLHRFAIEKDFFAGNEEVQPRVHKLDVLLQIASAMKVVHERNVIHGDLKPLNILISHFELFEDSRHFLAKITDFGSAKFIDKAFQPASGTTFYAAPEVLKLRQKQNVIFDDPTKIDIYSFGVTAYEILTGQAVYGVDCFEKQQVIDGTLQPGGSNEWQRVKKIYPLELIYCLESCWELKPEERPSFPTLCEVLERSKSKLLLLERIAANIWNFLAVFLIAFICVFVTSYIFVDL